MEEIKKSEKEILCSEENKESIKCKDPNPYRYSKQYIYGWDNAMSVAADIWSSIHSSLLNGELVFAYKNLNSNSELVQIVVVVNLFDKFGNKLINSDFGIGMVTSGYTSLLPHVPLDYLENQVTQDLKKYKVNKKIIDSFNEVIKNYKQ